MPARAEAALKTIERLRTQYGNGASDHKAELLAMLERRRLSSARAVHRLHEVLCYLRAYPDDAALLEQVERLLSAFADRSDLRRHRARLLNSGIAGTEIRFSFFAPTAIWLAERCGSCLTIDWEACASTDELERLLPALALFAETPAMDEFAFEAREWLDRLKGPDETDAGFLLRRFAQLSMAGAFRNDLLDEMDLAMRLVPGPGTPSRTHEKYAGASVAYQGKPVKRSRPSGKRAAGWRPASVRIVSTREGQALVDLARSAMVTRSRDLDAFAYGDPADVCLVDCGGGLEFAYIGVEPERRLLLETLYGFLMLKNGVPVGYGTNTSLFRSSEIAFTVFDTFRAGEAAQLFAWVLATGRHLFGADTYTIDPYQLGADNEDAIRSGAWWFYQKFGFAPRDAEQLGIMRRELARMRRSRNHRSAERTLTKLAGASVFLHTRRQRADVLGVLPLANVGLRVTEVVGDRFGFDRRRAARVCSSEAAQRLGLRSLRGFTKGQKQAWERWSPLIRVLPGVERWPRADQRALVGVVRAKGGQRESEYLQRFDGHRRLRQAIVSLAQED